MHSSSHETNFGQNQKEDYIVMMLIVNISSKSKKREKRLPLSIDKLPRYLKQCARQHICNAKFISTRNIIIIVTKMAFSILCGWNTTHRADKRWTNPSTQFATTKSKAIAVLWIQIIIYLNSLHWFMVQYSIWEIAKRKRKRDKRH